VFVIELGLSKSCIDVQGRLSTVLFHGHGIVQCSTDLGHLYRIYSIPTHDKHQWLLLQFIVLLMMDAKGVRNMWSIPAVVNKHNTARVASCWFIIHYRFVMHGNINIKTLPLVCFYFHTLLLTDLYLRSILSSVFDFNINT